MTNQASEDELKHILGNCPGMCKSPNCWFELHKHLIDIGEMDEAQEKAINALIRTEKLKLLAEVRERVVGEDKYPAKESSDLMKQLSPNVRRCEWQNELRGEQRTLLDKLEAEL